MTLEDLPPTRQQSRMVDDFDNFSKEKLIKNSAIEFMEVDCSWEVD